MLVALLSTIDSNVPVPPLSSMGVGTLTVPLFLWTETDRAPICKNEADLNGRPVLWTLLCMMNHHPSYTFSLTPIDSLLLADQLVNSIHTRVLQDIRNELPSNYGATNAYCYTTVKWKKCDFLASFADADACTKGLIQAYNTSSCEEAVGTSNTEWLDPCGYPDHFDFEDPVEVTLEELNGLNGGPRGGFLSYINHIQEQITQAAVHVATPIDFIGNGATWNEVAVQMRTSTSSSSSTQYYLPIVRVWPLLDFVASQQQDITTGGFNLSHWLKSQICQSTFEQSSICSNQYATTSTDPCLFPYTKYPPDKERYLQPPSPSPTFPITTTSEPVVTLYYADQETFDVINICDLPNEGSDGCVVQHLVCLLFLFK